MQVTQADAHAVMNRRRNADRDTDTQDGVREAERIKITVTKEQPTGGEAPEESSQHEKRVRHVSTGEQYGGGKHRGSLAPQQFQKPKKKEILQHELLEE